MYGDKGTLLSIISYAIEYWSLTVLSSLAFITCVLGIAKNNKKDNEFIILVASAIFLVLSYIIAAMSGRDHSYYALICIPTFVYPTFYALNYILNEKKQGILTFIIVLGITLIVFGNEISKSVTLINQAHSDKVVKERVIAEYVKENTEDSDEVIVLGNKSIINLLSERNSTAKYFFQISIADIDDSIAKEFLKWIKDAKPKMIVSYVEETTRNKSQFRKELFDYLDKIVKSQEYAINKDLVKNVIIYEKVK